MVVRTARPTLAWRHPVHVTLRLRDDAPNLRRPRAWTVVRAALRRGRERFGFRLIHFSVLTNHLHFICEAEDRRALSRGMQGLAIRIARAMNRLAGRRGKVFADRYHEHVLTSPREVRAALRYVLLNAAHHRALAAGALDVYSSGAYFDGWRERVRLRIVDDGPRPVVPATVWLLTTGWRRWGPISITEAPGTGRRTGYGTACSEQPNMGQGHRDEPHGRHPRSRNSIALG